MTGNAVIALRALTKNFGQIAAVDNLSLDLMEGEFFALLGPSGCGKTTLLRMIAGFEEPSDGEILLDGQDISGVPAGQRPFNLMFQSYALFPHMTVRANISYGLEMENLAKPEVKRRVDEIIHTAQLCPFENRKPDQLSGGQKQRVALARALIKRPRVLLLDEPLGALDKQLREQMQLELKRLQNESGITFVIVTHDQQEALVLADRIALMQAGRVVQLDSPRGLYEQPVNRFAANFIGVTNLLEGTGCDNGMQIQDGKTLEVAGDTSVGQPCALSIRPERISLSFQDAMDGCNGVAGTITDIAYQGQDLNVFVTVPGVEDPFTVRVSSADDIAAQCRTGLDAWCNWRPQHGLLLID